MFQDEKIVETRICRHCRANFDITDKDLEFYEKVSPVFPLSQPFPPREKGVEEDILLNGGGTKGGVLFLGNGKIKYLIPPPTLCPDCRQQRRLSFRNERKLYKRKCDFSGKDIISIYSPDKPYKVYEQKIWWGDKWEALDYGKDFDFSRGFFEQYEELIRKVPKINFHSHTSNENCPYTNYFVQSKNCYFCFGGGYSENVHYSSLPVSCKDSMEVFFSTNCENSYEISHSKNCYKLFFSDNCNECSHSYFLDSCNGCKNCFFCYGLSNKDYYIFNKKSSKEEFETIIKNLFPLKKEVILEMNNFIKNIPILYSRIVNSENCFGDYIYNSNFAINSFNIDGGENIKYSNTIIKEIKNVCDCFGSGINLENIYEVMTGSIQLYNVIFSSIVRENSKYIFYSFDINNCSNCFGCVGLRNKSYCILNKQYTKEEYEKLVPKIIEHMMTPPKSPSIEGESGAIVKQGEQEWGEFFPSSLSPFGYNETVANEYYPINTPPIPHPIPQKEKGNNSCLFSFSLGGKDAGKADRGTFNWSTYEAPFPKVDKIIPASKLPENIADIPDDILNWAIECEVTKKPFKIIKEELAFYRKHNLPIPRRHPDQRHLDRMSLRNPRYLYTRNCDKCGKEIQTTYAPERPEIVYCEECYNKEVY
ncbi:hypothetical protein HGA92_00635 [Candidatus Gracilibacteria bacterium]|nr:hypothetical protein [Candidatus Gracilibacteria bacterium]NUJ98885.1 hypothetical protein [Candidatus Gracilibacteria bacterium]